MIFCIDFTEKEVSQYPCIFCGKPSKRLLSAEHTPKESFAVPEGVTRLVIYGMCQECFDNRLKMSKDEIKKIAEALLREDAIQTRKMSAAKGPLN